MKKIIIGVAIAFASLFTILVIVAIAGSATKSAVAPVDRFTTSVTAPTTTSEATTQQAPIDVVVPSETSEAPKFSPQVDQARDSAQSYLSISAFSRNGLIRQLSSSAGEGFPKDVATEAVDSLSVDWNAQAAKSAESYLSVSSFSCSGLTQQLSSSAGEDFTKAQATYGAHQSAACK